MTDNKQITTLFLDIGGILLTNGWDRNARTLAAQALNVSQPTLSQQVKSLERHFDLPLIKRNRKAMQLTREGEIIFSYAA